MDKVLLIDDEADVLYSFRRIFADVPDIALSTASVTAKPKPSTQAKYHMELALNNCRGCRS